MISATPLPTASETRRPRVHSHPETILGTCQAIGEDLGINPNWLRAGFGVALVVNIAAAIGVYLALSLLVLALRKAMPDERGAVVEASAAPVEAGNDLSVADTREAA